ncbi:MAG: MFS transporter [bacterium]|nr:MFS transporter [bacterium]
MPGFRHLYIHFRKYGFSHTTLYTLSLMIFFWGIFDGILSYATPLILTQAGLSKSVMGVIIGMSSVAGAGFDFIVSKYFPTTSFRRLYLLMFAMCFVYPLILWQAKAIWLFFIAMALWGFYYDLQNFSIFDFVKQNTKTTEHSSSFGVISVFKSLGYLIAPIMAGLVIGTMVDWPIFLLAWIFLFFSYFCFLILMYVTSEKKLNQQVIQKKSTVWAELATWKRIGKIILPVLVCTLFLNIIDSFFWTIGPLFSESLTNLHPLGGLFVSVYILPGLFVGWIVGKVTHIYGKKRVAFASLLVSSLFLAMIGFVHNVILILIIVFLFAALNSLAWPAIKGAFADYISESTQSREIEGLEDFFTNIGYVVGPISAGFMADTFGNGGAFSLLGFLGVGIAVLLLLVTPKHLKVS